MLSIFKDKAAVYILFIGLLVRVIPSIFIPPGFDESYYGIYHLHPSMGYFDHPPMVEFTAAIGIWLTGSFSAISLRFGALLLYCLSLIVLYDIVKRLSDENSGKISLILGHIIPYFLMGMGAFVIPDNGYGLFMLIFIWSLLRINETGNDKFFLLSGAALGFAFLSKYHAVLLLGGLFLLLVFYKDWRKFLGSVYLYAGVVLCFVIFSPNIIWNYQHDWVSYAYQFGKSTGVTNLNITTFLQGIFAQAGYLLPWIMVILIMALFKTRSNKNLNWILPFAILPIIAFTLVGATRQIMPHWPMPGYLAALIPASIWIAVWKPGQRKSLIGITGGITFAAVVIITLQAITGFLPLEKKADVTLDGQGWSEVYNEIKEQGLINSENTFVFTTKWFLSGEFEFASKGNYPVFAFNPESPYSYAFWDKTAENIGKNGIFITTDRFHDDPVAYCAGYFEDFEMIKKLTTYRGNNEAQVFEIWICKNLLKPFPNPYEKYMKK